MSMVAEVVLGASNMKKGAEGLKKVVEKIGVRLVTIQN
jgi:hypothetical protein